MNTFMINRHSLIAIGSIVALLAIITGGIIYFNATGLAPVTQTPPNILTKGEQVFTFSTTKRKGSRIIDATISPLDASVDATQTILVRVDPTATQVKSMTATFITDGKKEKTYTLHPLSLGDGRWSAGWQVETPHNMVYVVTITAFGTDGSKTRETIRIR